MTSGAPAGAVAVVVAFAAGFLSHVLYQRWNPPAAESEAVGTDGGGAALPRQALEPQSHRVIYLPSASAPRTVDLPLLPARDIEKIRALAGNPARVRGRVFRVGHSGKSNTYFLNFGPSRQALTAVIFASAAESFERSKVAPKSFEGREVEVHGEIKDHPQYGLEIILESPAQIKLLD